MSAEQLQRLFPLVIFIAVIIGYLVYLAPFLIGVRRQSKGDVKTAERCYSFMLRLNRKFWPARFNRALMLVNKRQYEAALGELDQVMQFSNGSFTQAYNLRAVAYINLKQYDLAAENYQTTLSWYADRKLLAGANVGLANICFSKYQSHKPASDPARDAFLDQALVYLDKARRLEPKNLYAIGGKAQIYRRKGDHRQALLIYEQALARMPKSALLLNDRSTVYLSLHNFDAAIADCTKAVQLDPKMSFPYNNRAYALIFKGDLEQALTNVNQALTLNPRSAFGLNTRGTVNFLLDRPEEALRDFQQALDLESRDEYAHAGVAVVMHQIGWLNEAKAQWQQLIALDETYRDADHLQKDEPIAPAFLEEARLVVALLQTSDVPVQ